jgi:TldD protein
MKMTTSTKRRLCMAGVALGSLASLGFGKEVVLTPARTFVEDDAAVTRAMTEELARSMKDLRLGDSPRPYYLAYAVSDVDQAVVTATFGAATGGYGYRGRTLRTDVRVGDPAFDNSNTAESIFGGNVESLPVDDDYAALRREMWLRTDEAYKNAIETLAKKRSAAAGQANRDDDGDVADFSRDKPAQIKIPFPDGIPEPDQLRDIVVRLSAIPRTFPDIAGCRVTGTYATVRRRFVSSEGAASDEKRGTVRIDVVAETQAADGMRLVNFVTFAALAPSGLSPMAEMEQGVRRMAGELVAMRTAPIATSGAASVLFEGTAAGQVAKLLLGDNLSGTPAPRTAGGGEERGQTSDFAERLGQKVASPLLMAVDDPLRDTGPGKTPLFGAYRVDDEGIAAERVIVIEAGILKRLLMTRTPRKEIAHSNGHARATRFGGPRAAVGNLVLSGKSGAARGALSRAALLTEMTKAEKGGGLRSYIVRLLDDPTVPGIAAGEDGGGMFSIGGGGRSVPSVKPLVVYRLGAGGKEELVRGLTLEGLVPRSLKDIVAVGKDSIVYNYQDGGTGFVGVPSSVVTPPLLFTDVDVRRSIGKNKRAPLYPRPALQ